MSRASTPGLHNAFAAKIPEIVAIQHNPALLLAYLGWHQAPVWASSILQTRPTSLILTAPPKNTKARIIILAIGLSRLFTNRNEFVRHIYEADASRKESLYLLRKFVQTFRTPEVATFSKSPGSIELAWNSEYRLTPRGQMEFKATTLTVLEYPSAFPDIVGQEGTIVLCEFDKVPNHSNEHGWHWHAICPACQQQARSDLFWQMDKLELRCPNCESDQAPIQGQWETSQPSGDPVFHVNSLMDSTNRPWQKALCSGRRKAATRAFGFSNQKITELRFNPLRLTRKGQKTEGIKLTEQTFAGIDWGHKRTHLAVTRIAEGQIQKVVLVHVQAFRAFDDAGRDAVHQVSSVLRAMGVGTVVHDHISIGHAPGITLRKLIAPAAVIDASVSTGERDQYITEHAIRFDKDLTAKNLVNAVNCGELFIAPDVFELENWPEAHQHLSAVRVRLPILKYQVSPRRSRDDFYSATMLAFLAAKHFARICGVRGS